MKRMIVALLALMLLLAACGGEEKAVEVNVQELYKDLEAVGMPKMVEVNQDMMLSLYGIKAEDTKQAKVMICDDGLKADEVWLIEAVDAAAAKRIVEKANSRIAQKDAESATYDPEQNAIVKKTLVVTQGNYVFMITSPNVNKMEKVINDALGK